MLFVALANKVMKTTRDPIYDQIACTYQSLEAHMLNECLLDNGIETEKRREILGGFLFRQGMLLEQYWFKEQEKKWYSGVFFSDRPHDQLNEATIFLPDEQIGMNYHEYAHGAADWAIENQENPDAIESGNSYAE
jgi:hypothetical protein